jgi:hypothetical protein
MLFDALFGNGTIEKVLFFLLVNEKGYATEISHCLDAPLTPIQQALSRLENGSILCSWLEGKTRLFRFNLHYPFNKALQALLKEGYRQLSHREQQSYFHRRHERNRESGASQKDKQFSQKQSLSCLWKSLQRMTHLSFSAKSNMPSPSGWNGTGKAEVQSSKTSPNCLVFQETGVWTSDQGKQYDFKNSYRWTKDPRRQVIALEHLRHGRDHPVFLFELTPVSPSRFETTQPFLCRNDTYFAELNSLPTGIEFHWRILGPKKNEQIHYIYSEL